jgi:exonuclease III
MRCVVALNIQSGARSPRAERLCCYLDSLDPDTVILTEWRANASGQTFAEWAKARKMIHQKSLNDGCTANGVFLASKDRFDPESATPAGQGSGCLLLARFQQLMLLACYFPQFPHVQLKAAFFHQCLELARLYQVVPFVLAGDLNTGNQIADRSSKKAGKFHCSANFDRLSSDGGLSDLWRCTNGAAREWSWCSRANGFRIDHAFGNALFVRASPVCTYDHRPRLARLTDQSAVVLRMPFA